MLQMITRRALCRPRAWLSLLYAFAPRVWCARKTLIINQDTRQHAAHICNISCSANYLSGGVAPDAISQNIESNAISARPQPKLSVKT